MIVSSLAALALAASALASPFSNPFHMHPKMPSPDARVSLALVNTSINFRDVKIAGRTYTVRQHETLYVKAPVGTIIYADSRTPTSRRGDVLLQVTPQVDHTQVNLN